MAIYAIGDVHGCYEELMALLKKVQFDRKRDKVYFVGDLINRGPDSSAVIDFVCDHEDCVYTVLGNHDISLLAYHEGIYKKSKEDFDKILKRKDADDVLIWLASRPLTIDLPKLDVFIVHAGVLPQWSIKQCEKVAREAELMLQSDKRGEWLSAAYMPGVDVWSEKLSKKAQFRFTLNALTRMRFCEADGRLNYKEKRSASEVARETEKLTPWFRMRKKQQKDARMIVFGHWASLGLNVSGNTICLDSGCAWGGSLTAIRLDDAQYAIAQVEKK